MTQIRALIEFAPEGIRNAPEGYWERTRPRALIERIFDNIGHIAGCSAANIQESEHASDCWNPRQPCANGGHGSAARCCSIGECASFCGRGTRQA